MFFPFSRHSKIETSFVLIILFTLLFSSAAIAGELKKLYDKKFEVNPGEEIELKASFGDVEISTWDKNELQVDVWGTRKVSEKVRFKFERTSRGVRIWAKKRGSSWFNWFSSYQLKFKIRVPKKFDADIVSSGGDIDIAGLEGVAIVKTSGGDIEFSETKGKLKLDTSGGDIKIRAHDGIIDMETSGGDIIGKDIIGSVKSETSGGEIRLEVESGKVYGHTSGGNIRLIYFGENQGIKLSTSGGDIVVYVSDDFAAKAELRSSGGDVECNLDSARGNTVSSGKFYGNIGNGGEELFCKTSGGDITVDRY